MYQNSNSCSSYHRIGNKHWTKKKTVKKIYIYKKKLYRCKYICEYIYMNIYKYNYNIDKIK